MITLIDQAKIAIGKHTPPNPQANNVGDHESRGDTRKESEDNLDASSNAPENKQKTFRERHEGLADLIH